MFERRVNPGIVRLVDERRQHPQLGDHRTALLRYESDVAIPVLVELQHDPYV
jgi:hypothetical protein